MSDVVEIPERSGDAFRLAAGQTLTVIDPRGVQVADLLAYSAEDLAEVISSGRTLDYAETIYLTTGNLLYSNRSRPMLTIVDDTCGRHDFLLTPCSQEMFEILYRHVGHHPSCFENLYTAFAEFGIRPEQIHTTFNVFMNVTVSPEGTVAVLPPTSKPGDTIELRAEMDLVCALTSCSAEQSNNGTFKPIDYEIVAAGRP